MEPGIEDEKKLGCDPKKTNMFLVVTNSIFSFTPKEPLV
jgi:hypothetical protein